MNDKGKEIECFVIFTHFDAAFNKHYIVYTPTEMSAGATQLYAAVYNPNNNGDITDFQKIESDEEWAMIEEKIKELQDAIKKGDW